MKRYLLLLLVVLSSCSTNEVEKDEYAECVEEANLQILDISQKNVQVVGDTIAIINGDMIVDIKMTSKGAVITGKGDGRALWPGGIIPYYIIDGELPEDVKDVVRRGFQKTNNETVIEAVEYANRSELIADLGEEQHYIYIKAFPFSSASYVGMRTNSASKGQAMLFAYIDEEYVAQHELGHAAGFWHEQNRTDRDDYITVHFENIYDGAKDQYDIELDTKDLGEFNFGSIMLYSSYKYSKNEKPTLTKKNGDTWGTNKILNDIEIANYAELYKCEIWRHRNK